MDIKFSPQNLYSNMLHNGLCNKSMGTEDMREFMVVE